MKLYVKNTNAKMETFDVPETTSIFDLKNLYVSRLGTGEKAEDLYFTLSGKILRNDFPLDDYILLLMLIILKLKIFYINL